MTLDMVGVACSVSNASRVTGRLDGRLLICVCPANRVGPNEMISEYSTDNPGSARMAATILSRYCGFHLSSRIQESHEFTAGGPDTSVTCSADPLVDVDLYITQPRVRCIWPEQLQAPACQAKRHW